MKNILPGHRGVPLKMYEQIQMEPNKGLKELSFQLTTMSSTGEPKSDQFKSQWHDPFWILKEGL